MALPLPELDVSDAVGTGVRDEGTVGATVRTGVIVWIGVGWLGGAAVTGISILDVGAGDTVAQPALKVIAMPTRTKISLCLIVSQILLSASLFQFYRLCSVYTNNWIRC